MISVSKRVSAINDTPDAENEINLDLLEKEMKHIDQKRNLVASNSSKPKIFVYPSHGTKNSCSWFKTRLPRY